MKKLIISSFCTLFASTFITSVSHAQTWDFTARWKAKPQVFVCYEGIDIEIVESAISFWEKELKTSIPPAQYATCKISPPWGSIYIDIDDSRLSYRENGYTDRVYTGDTFSMKSADILIRSDLVGESRLITHEIGHALGLSHSDDVNSIMYPIQIFDDFDFTSSQ